MNQVFAQLLSDELLVEASLASDIQSRWRRLARAAPSRAVAEELGSEPSKIHELCRFLEELVAAEHDQAFLHPHEYAVCAGLVILEQSPLSCARNLIARLKNDGRPSLYWVRRMAGYCDYRFSETTGFRVGPGRASLAACGRGFSDSSASVGGPDAAFASSNSGTEAQETRLSWSDPQVEQGRFQLALAA